MIDANIISLSEIEWNRIDAEFYSADIISLMKKLKSLKFDMLGNHFDVNSGSTPVDRIEGLKDGIILLKTANIRDGYVDIYAEQPFFIDQDLDEKLKSSRLQPNDILINIVGATLEVIGRSAIVPESFPKANITQAMCRLRAKDGYFLPEFTLIFLQSKFGRRQISRIARPTAQFNINNEEVRNIILPRVAKEAQNKVKSLYDKFFSSYKESIDMYRKAEDLLLSELNIKKMDIENHNIFYNCELKDVVESERLDAEYFQPKYKKLIRRIKSGSSSMLKELFTFHKGIEVGSEAYNDNGVPFIRVNNLTKMGINDTNQQFISKDTYLKLRDKFQPNKNELLISKDGTPGIATIISDNREKIISSGIIRLKPKVKLDLEYVSLLLNSFIVQYQINRDSGGSILIHWQPKHIENTIVPILSEKQQIKLGNLVRDSFKLRNESFKILNEAKNLVELEVNKLN